MDETRSSREPLSVIEREKFEAYAAEIFMRIGLDLNSPGAEKTPRRWLKALVDMTSGYEGDQNVKTLFPNECPACPEAELGHIVEGPIHVVALCEHHILPIEGEAWVGYLAKEEVVGISKLTRLVRMFSRRFTSQERITQEVAGCLEKLVKPQGVAVYIEAYHHCTKARGVREPHVKTSTFAARGVYNIERRLRDEFMAMRATKSLNGV